MRDNISKEKTNSPSVNAIFLDSWPQPPKYNQENENDRGMSEVKKWRLQMLLAVNPFGIPSLAFSEAYQKMFNRPLEVRELGFEHLSEMVSKMTDIFAVQEPDESTGILFPDYPRDNILHDARLGYDFAKPNFDQELCASQGSVCNSLSSESLTASLPTLGSNLNLHVGTASHSSVNKSNYYNDLIHRAWMDRDEDFPPDVVLAGEPYEELLIISSASIPGTRGLYQATLLSVATPDSFYVQLKTNEQVTRQIQEMSTEIENYFSQSSCSIDAYSVPKEFMYPGFPCLAYVGKQGRLSWDRCIISARTKNSPKVLVESVDYGGWYAVDPIYLYLIPRKFLEVPRQTFQLSLAGIKPPSMQSEDETTAVDRWPVKAGPRMRGFSYHNYWLDLLLMDPRKARDPSFEDTADKRNQATKTDEKNGEANDLSTTKTGAPDPKAEKMRQRFRGQPRYDAILLDRNDEEFDIFLDEMLVLETYATFDETRKQEIDGIKQNLKEALKNVPRPKNPFYA